MRKFMLPRVCITWTEQQAEREGALNEGTGCEMKNLLRDEQGNILVLLAICMTVLIGFMGMGVDVGLLYRARQQAQIAADAAAVAAAVDYEYNGSTGHAELAGMAASSTNGFTNGSNGIAVTINSPPVSGPSLGTGYFEAIVSAPTPAMFTRVLGFSNFNVAARAVAGVIVGDACIWSLATSGVGLNVQGSYDIEAPSCGAYVYSTSSDAIQVNGNSGTMNTKFVDVAGSFVGLQTNPTPITANAVMPNSPWGNISDPNPANCTAGATLSNSSLNGALSNDTTTLNNAVAAAIASPTGGYGYVCFTNEVLLSGTLNFPPTTPASSSAATPVIYIFQGGVEINTGANVTFGATDMSGSGANVTFSNTNGAMIDLAGCANPLKCSGSGSQVTSLMQDSGSMLSVYAPTQGVYNGIAIYQPTSNPTPTLQVQFGSNNGNLDGYIYAPGAQVFYQDSGGGVVAAGIVANTIGVQTTTFTIPVSYAQANALTTLSRIVALVE